MLGFLLKYSNKKGKEENATSIQRKPESFMLLALSRKHKLASQRF